MNDRKRRRLLTLLPMAAALIAGTGAQWIDPSAGFGPAPASGRALVQACESAHAVLPQPVLRSAARPTQSPGWLSEHRAQVERCLGNEINGTRSASASG
jgi:hypothetical protein